MSTSPTQSQTFAEIKQTFDAVLVKYLSQLLEVDLQSDALSFDLSTIACLLLVVERENDVKASDGAVSFYTKETFLDALTEMGLEVDEKTLESFESLVQQGLVALDKDNNYRAQLSAVAVVNFIDNIFPGMPGMSLVGYVLQMIHEVLDERKHLDKARESFEQTLSSRGIPLSKQKLQQKEKEQLVNSARQRKQASNLSRTATQGLRDAYSRRLATLRQAVDSPKTTARPLFNHPASTGQEARVKDVFPRPHQQSTAEKNTPDETPVPDEDSPVLAGAARDQAEAAPTTPSAPFSSEKWEEPGPAAESSLTQPAEGASEKEASRRFPEESQAKNDWPGSTISPADAEQAPQTPLDSPPAPPTGAAQGPDDEKGHLSIEARINQFEQDLAMACPVCQNGQIKNELTEKQATYYYCSNQSCGFISWGKPYPFACPLCKNPFLIEFFDPHQQVPGLKCPRAACSFTQQGLSQPDASGPPIGKKDSPAPKRKKLVRVKRK